MPGFNRSRPRLSFQEGRECLKTSVGKTYSVVALRFYFYDIVFSSGVLQTHPPPRALIRRGVLVFLV